MTLLGRTKRGLASVLQRLLATRGYTIARPERLAPPERLTEALHRAAESEALRMRTVRQLHDLYVDTLMRGLPPCEGRVELLGRMRGTDVSAAMYLVHHLHASLRAPGDVCEFGVAEGRTSALLANELLGIPDRSLWLYDTFTGLPDPGEKDVLLDDQLRLGDAGGYAGWLAHGEEEVRAELAAVGFPEHRTRIVPGLVPRDLTDDRLPETVAFAYLDMDFYDGTRGALDALHDRLSAGSTVVLDDYAYFTAGPKTATEEFLAAHPLLYEFEIGPRYAGHFAVLSRR